MHQTRCGPEYEPPGEDESPGDKQWVGDYILGNRVNQDSGAQDSEHQQTTCLIISQRNSSI